ncbi:MAG: adenosine-specific kinase [bacterium]
MQLHTVKIEKPEGLNVIMGQSHFIKTVEDIYEALVGTVPGIKFGLAFNESSGPRLVRLSGTDDSLKDLAKQNAMNIGAGHLFILLLENAFPINVMKALKDVPEICEIYCATANPVEVIVAETEQGRGVMGLVDGQPPVGEEQEADVQERKEFLRKIGYKL